MNHPPASFTLDVRAPGSMFTTDSPLRRDGLHPDIAETLLDWAKTVDDRSTLAVDFVVPAEGEVGEAQVADSLHAHFARVAENHTRQIRHIFRHARAATVIGLLVVVVLLSSAQAIPDDAGRVMLALRESLTIFAWVAMWKPADLWLYAHWPERYWRRQALRLASARIRVLPRSAIGGGAE